MALQTGPVKAEFERKYSPSVRQRYDEILNLTDQGRIGEANEKISISRVTAQMLKDYITDKKAFLIAKQAELDQLREDTLGRGAAFLVRRQQVIDAAANQSAPKLPDMGNADDQNGMKLRK